MKKDDKTLLWVIGIILFLSFPGLFILGIVIYAIYQSNKGKSSLKSSASKIKEKYKNSDKTSNYEVIDTTGEVVDSKIIPKDEWTAIKEYRH